LNCAQSLPAGSIQLDLLTVVLAVRRHPQAFETDTAAGILMM
jgi:hypothetical protein